MIPINVFKATDAEEKDWTYRCAKHMFKGIFSKIANMLVLDESTLCHLFLDSNSTIVETSENKVEDKVLKL